MLKIPGMFLNNLLKRTYVVNMNSNIKGSFRLCILIIPKILSLDGASVVTINFIFQSILVTQYWKK